MQILMPLRGSLQMRVEVAVVPGAGSFRVSCTKDGRLKVYLKNKPEGNKANIELIKKLGKELTCSVSIISGASSRHKLLELGISEENWGHFLSSIKE